MQWLLKFAESPKKIGSIAPSSKALGDLMVKRIYPSASILELGAGSGSITECILNQLANQETLTSVELDPELCNLCQKKFPNVRFLNQDIQETLSKEKSYDFIISGIPFAAMPQKRRQQLFNLIHQRLAPGGSFIMFQYSIISRKELHKIFGNITTNFTPWNLPPAFVFTCHKQ